MARQEQYELPPHDVEAEKSVIGSLLIDDEAIYKVKSFLPCEAFFTPENQWVYEACLSVCDNGGIIDQITIARELASKNKLDEVGGAAYLSHLIVIVPTSLHIEYYAKVVKDCYIQRCAINYASQVSSLGYRINDTTKLVSEIGEGYLNLQSKVAQPQLLAPSEWAKYSSDKLWSQQDGRRISISTGITQLDDVTGGLFPGEYWILAAYAGIGKTTVALQIADTLALFGNVLYVGLEMSATDIFVRRLANKVSSPFWLIRSGGYSEKLEKKLIQATGELSESNLYYLGQAGAVTTGGGVTIDTIYSMVRYMKLAVGIKAVIIDYIQIVRGNEKNSRYERTSDISNRIQMMAQTLEVPVIALSQVSRGAVVKSRPEISDLRDSGMLESDADVVLLMYRDKTGKDETIRQGECEIEVGKQRQGDSGRNVIIHLAWNQDTHLYGENEEHKIKQGWWVE